MLNLGVMALTFALIFVAELPDKSAIATLILSTRFPWRWVFLGVAGAFLAHMAIAVFAGSLLALLPSVIVHTVVTILFFLGAVLIWREGRQADNDDEEVDTTRATPAAGAWQVTALSFGTIFIGEWGDLTQILAANLAAQNHAPLEVGIGATLALWCVALVAVLGGRSLLKVVPVVWITRIAAIIMLVLGVVSGVEIFRS